jgi:cytoskeleton protein RodZ
MLGVLVLVLFPESRKVSFKGDAEPAAIAATPMVSLSPVATQVSPNPVEPIPVSGTAVSLAMSSQPDVAPKGEVISKASELIAPVTEVIAFKVRGTSWIEVRDLKGVVLLSTTLKAGENITTTGVFPLSIVIGRVDVTDVQVRGMPFPLDTVAKDNVARFEVK